MGNNDSKSVSECDYQQMKDDLKQLAEIFLGPKAKSSNLDDLTKNFLPPEPPEKEDDKDSDRKTTDKPEEKNNIGAITFRSVMGTGEGEQLGKKSYPVGPDGKKLKPCCACPETKRARDTCIIEKGEENCTELIEAHKACMRSLGFNI